MQEVSGSIPLGSTTLSPVKTDSPGHAIGIGRISDLQSRLVIEILISGISGAFVRPLDTLPLGFLGDTRCGCNR